MESVAPQDNPHAYKYAFTLTIIYHLRVLQKLGALEASLQEDAVSRADYLHYLKITSDYFVPAIAKKHRTDDVQMSANWGLPTKSLSYNFYRIVLGGSENSSRRSTEQLLEDTDSNVESPYELWSREDDLGELLYPVLKTSFSRVLKTADLPDSTKLSAIVAAYLIRLEQECKEMNSPETQYVSHAEKLAQQLGSVTPEHFEVLEQVFNAFSELLEQHVELLMSRNGPLHKIDDVISQLREKGNNLMINSAFPQAIQVYTNAIDKAVGEAVAHTPQLLVNRAIAYIGLNCFAEAIQDLNQAVSLDRTFSPAWIQLGYAQLYIGHSVVALKCYTTAFACMAGRILPFNFPQDRQLIEEYETNNLQSILPQFVRQVLKSVKLVEQRAIQQRFDSIEIARVRATLMDLLQDIKAAMPEQEQYSCTYPPVETDDNSFRALSERVNRARPNILTHEVSQNILTGGGDNDDTRRSAMIAVEAIRPNIPPPPVAATIVNPESTAPHRAALAAAAAATAAAAHRRNNPPPAANPEEPFGEVRGLLNTFGDVVESMNAQAPNPPPRASTAAATTTTTANEPSAPERPNFRPTRSDPQNIVREALGGILPEFLSEGLSNVLTQSFGRNGGEVVFNTQRPPARAADSTSTSEASRDQDAEMSPEDLD